MPRSRRRSAVALATFASLAASAASCAPPRRQTMHFEVPERHATLPNGMRVILLPDSSSPLVEVDMRYAVGAAEDPQGKSGLAHVVEHMVFQERPAGDEMPSSFSALAQVATFFNASTTWDSTHYVAAARPEELGTLLAIESARLRLGCETVTPAAFARELEVVRNENREKASDPDTAVFARIEQAVYPPGHAYHRPVGGDDAEVVALTLDDVCRFIYDNLLIEGLERWVKVGQYGGFDELPREVELEAKNRDLQASLRFESVADGAVFGDTHPYARTGRATTRSAPGLDLYTVRDFGLASYVAGNATLVVTGNFDPARVESIIRDKYGSWDHGSAPRPVPAPAPLAAGAAQGPRRLGVAGPARPSLRVRIEFPAPAIGGGYAGRLILAQMLAQRVALVRQRLGASYGVNADLEVHAQGSVYVIEGQVDAGRAGEALAAMREGLESLRRGDDFERGFALARRVVLAQLEAQPTTAEGLAQLWAEAVVHGLGADFHGKLVHAVASAQPAQVKALVASDLDVSREVIVILGAKDVVAKAYADAKLEMTRWIE